MPDPLLGLQGNSPPCWYLEADKAVTATAQGDLNEGRNHCPATGVKPARCRRCGAGQAPFVERSAAGFRGGSCCGRPVLRWNGVHRETGRGSLGVAWPGGHCRNWRAGSLGCAALPKAGVGTCRLRCPVPPWRLSGPVSFLPLDPRPVRRERPGPCRWRLPG
jgi:hypothetical protein